MRGDLFSNMHYGYTMSVAGVALKESLRLANGEWNLFERAVDVLAGPLLDLPDTGRNGPGDDFAVTVGYNLCQCPADGVSDPVPSPDSVRQWLIDNKQTLFKERIACIPGSGRCTPIDQW